MIISFDLDDTLIPGIKTFETEKQNFLHRLIGLEKIRKGSIFLFKKLKSKGHLIYIYTTSYRSDYKIKWMFRMYGIPVDRIINQNCHVEKMKESGFTCSKYPPAFGIDVHVDDSYGVKMEGDRYNFKTIIVVEEDEFWYEQVLNNLS